MIVVVTGLPRSGTTCMMRMLEAGGIPPYYDQDMPMEFKKNGVPFINGSRILRETDKIYRLKQGDGDWVHECEGMAVKILTPTVCPPPKGPEYRFIWMARKVKHMAKSQQKWLKRSKRIAMPDKDIDQADLEVVQERARRQKKEGIALLVGYPDSELMVVRFEDMIRKSVSTAYRVSEFVGGDLDFKTMAGVVWERPAHCLENMMEYDVYGRA